MLRRATNAFSSWVDDLVLTAVVLGEVRRGFSRTRPLDPPRFEELLEELRAAPPALAWPAGRPRRRVAVSLPALGEASFLDLFPARGEADTLVVYHHGLGEIPHDMVPRLLRLSPRLARCDLVALKGIDHQDARQVNARLLADRERFVRGLIGSAAVARAVARQARPRYRHLALCGVSLGGVVSLVEASREPRFDVHVPFVAGPDLADVLFASSFARLVQAGWRRRERRAAWTRELVLTERLAAEPGPPIRALLAEGDALFRCAAQQAAYARIPRATVAVRPGGHITLAARVDLLAAHLAQALREVCWAPAGADQLALSAVAAPAR